MRHIGLVIFFIISMLSTSTVAQADCAVIDTLSKLHSIQARLARDPNTALFATDIRQIRAMSRGISNSAALDAVDGNSFTGHGADVIRFLQNTQSLLQGASLDDPLSVRRHFNGQVRENLAQVRNHLVRLQCSDDQIAVDTRAAAERSIRGNSDAADLQEVAENLSALAEEVFQLRSLAVTVAVIVLMMTLAPVLRRWRILRRRRAKRHTTTFETTYRWDANDVPGTLIDINCYGAKLRHQADQPIPPGSIVEIAFGSEWTRGTIMWANAHYSGVQFNKSISLATVDTVCKAVSAKTVSETQNGAPRDAA